MKVALIQIDLVMGARVILSLLSQKGHSVKSLQINIRYTDLFAKEDLETIYEYVGDPDVVGLSFNTFYAVSAKQLAVFLKKKGIKHIIVGGNHVTALPDEAIEFSDIVIRYEAEITFPRVLEALEGGHGLLKIEGIVYKSNGEVFKNNGTIDIMWDLNALPFQSVDTNIIKYFDLKRKIYTPDRNTLFPHSKGCYFILASRGCPFSCTYCSNSLYHNIDKRFSKVRKRTIDNILSEMEYALSNGFESFYIVDDHFFSFTLDELKEFNRGYRERINKPFSISGLNPNNLRAKAAREKINLLISCGLSDVRIGVQSGSDKTLKIFKRGYKAQDIPALLAPIEENRNTIWEPPHDKLHVALDFICDAVWESPEDKIETIQLARKVLTQYTIFFYTLVYLPGTELYNLAIKNGWIEDKVSDIYLKGIAGVEDNIYNRILFLIAVTKERGITFSQELLDFILKLSRTDEAMTKNIVNSIIDCVNKVETHHNINHKHATLHPYLRGFNEWTKVAGQVGKKVLFRSYHQAYG